MLQVLPLPEWIDDAERMLQVCREIRDVGICGLDTETTGKDDMMKEHVLFWSLAPTLDVRYCLSRRMLEIFDQELAGDPDIIWAMTNSTFDRCMLRNSGVRELAGPVHCTLVMDFLHDENRRHGLKFVAKDHIGLNMRKFKEVFKKKKGETYQDTLIRMMREEPDSAFDYASMDAWATLAVHRFLKKKLEEEHTCYGIPLWKLFESIEVPYSKVLYNNTRNGLMIDQGWLRDIRGPITEKMEEILFKFYKLAGKEINLKSPKQLVDLFIRQLGYKPIKWTKGGQSGNRNPSVDVSVITKWAEDGDELCKLLLEYRSLEKVRGTYIDGMLKRISADGRIHSTINQHVTATGRLSSSNPNLQNIPRPGDDVWQLRGAFMPGDGYTLVAIDYRQLEMRILAHMSGDENMRDVIRRGWDIHAGTAALMYEVPYEEIQEAKFLKGWLNSDHVPSDKWPSWISEFCSHRQDAKSIGFGINYGEGDRALAEKLGISIQEAKARKEKYFEPYPRVREFIEATHQECRETLEVHTLLGRKRRLFDADLDWKPGFYSNRYRKWVPERPGKGAARALRQDVNSIIQGSAADAARLAQILCEPSVANEIGLYDEHIEQIDQLGIKQLLQVHDEIIFEVPTEHLHEGIDCLSRSMERPFRFIPEMTGMDFRELSIPLDVDAGYGESWAEAH